MRGLAEAQRVHHRDWPCTHGEDVAHNAADAGRCALIGLDEAWMVVALHLEDAGITVADVDDASVFAGPLQHPRRLRRELAQMDARRLVGAVLAPHHAEDAEFDEARFAVQESLDAAILVVAQPMFGDKLRRDLGHDKVSIRLSNMPRPSVPPSSGSTTRSGCGMRPKTLRFSLRMPAMLRAEPLGLCPGAYRKTTRPSPSRRLSVSSSAK